MWRPTAARYFFGKETPTMPETQEAYETVEYEAPELVEAGDFTELTLGFHGHHWDGWGGRGHGWW
ncbi:hypothetical protein ADK47_05160 [Streptomyces rimosus subsp. rimosus]|nr:hypothetical protein DF17_13180 [Streptomyces rimosus]KOG77789.1 hypothetical protein ADK78_08535 [Kitasatospora aureofaciens]KOT40087.1 hypothetical protein ADK42_14560 [Streptomyces rimosus subsp. rimosus]KOT42992.1 hypothetical protein ADK84_09410 [Streptomyces sp. NRRL WC-3701]KEF16848.1 hypothetical protein DF18_32700 [Streptomyces rimosus]